MLPLVVDLDGTLLQSDLLIESFFSMAAHAPLRAVKALASLRRGKAALKSRLADGMEIDVGRLPWNGTLLTHLRDERARGRKLYLASASHRRLVERVAAHLDLFDGVFASDETCNLKGHAKADLLRRIFGDRGFDYVGNEIADFAVWDRAANVVVVASGSAFVRAVKAKWPHARQMPSQDARMRDYLNILRPHQWLKNLLIFAPLLAAHQIDAGRLGECLLAFFSFCLCASSVYCLNDLLDLNQDRTHPTKRHRALAAGRVPLVHGLVLYPMLLAGAIVSALMVGFQFTGVLAAYCVATMAYSVRLKRMMMIDVVVLACLYGLRLVAGGAAVDVPISSWLAAFALFLFCSLALVKRCTELISRSSAAVDTASGRDYGHGDLPILEALAAASGFTAILVFALYLSSPAVAMLYRAPERLWLLCVILVYWIGRVLILAHRGEMHDDPVVFAATDRGSLVCGALAAVIVLASL